MRRPRRRTLFVLGGLLVVLVAAGLFVWLVVFGGLEKPLVPAFAERQARWRGVHGPLLGTRWAQGGAYAAFAPDHQLLGCWSVAFAQVLAHHRLAPKGRVMYRAGGRAIDETLDQPVAWEQMRPALEPGEAPEASAHTARYVYHAAIVVQKDFGRGEYKDIARVPDEIAEHYGATVERVTSHLADTVRSELRAGRPLVAYFDDILGIRLVRNGHAAVFDGMATHGDALLVHVNFGWAGSSDGWYTFDTLASQRKLRYVFCIRP